MQGIAVNFFESEAVVVVVKLFKRGKFSLGHSVHYILSNVYSPSKR